jgi:hypothetical protein
MEPSNIGHGIIEMLDVESSQIAKIGHHTETETLAIQFMAKDGAIGSVYHYRNFTADDFSAFKNAESVGSYFYKNIKPHSDKFPYKKIS